MSALTLAVLLSLVSAVAYAGAAIVQERVAAAEPGTGPHYAPMHRPVWWAAVGLNGLGAVLHVAALAFGPLSLVQPLGALTIVFALPMAAVFVRRRAGATAWRGAVMATLGLAGLLALTGASDSQSLSGLQRVGVASVTAGSIVALMVTAHALHSRPAVRSVLLATASGAAFGIASVFTKTVALDWSGGSTLPVLLPTLAVTAVMAVAGLLLSQASYRDAGLAAPLSTLTVVNPVVAAGVGLTMFGESFQHGTAGAVLALGCGAVAAGGLVLLTTERIHPSGPAAGDRAVPAVADGRPFAAGGTVPHPVIVLEGAAARAGERASVSGRLTPLPDDAAQQVPGRQAAAPGAASEVPQQPAPVFEGLERLQREERLPELRQLPGVRELPGLDALSDPREEPQRSTLPHRLPHQPGGAERSAGGWLAPCGRLRS
ncbi:DMT family transporter [Streptomyces sp. TS71-3]|uniref:DMT family transporter n=1 Tax=Streptomyces sp. TS71-3 TaxID=2733862 RepID=UPI001B16F25C|nr:DMT family transporter [Streptomyces sp. TS71-3]GHJ42101.1 membrane protein [Streptomyces sp. TS71-3]